jgi:hypothetical protein
LLALKAFVTLGCANADVAAKRESERKRTFFIILFIVYVSKVKTLCRRFQLSCQNDAKEKSRLQLRMRLFSNIHID